MLSKEPVYSLNQQEEMSYTVRQKKDKKDSGQGQEWAHQGN